MIDHPRWEALPILIKYFLQKKENSLNAFEHGICHLYYGEQVFVSARQELFNLCN